MITGFSHMQLVARDVPASAEWYSAALGLEPYVSGSIESGPYVGLRHPTAGFVIGLHTATPDEAGRLSATAVDHCSFAVADLETLQEQRADLSARGIAVGDIFEEQHTYNLRLDAPDGMVLELTAPKPRRPRTA